MLFAVGLYFFFCYLLKGRCTDVGCLLSFEIEKCFLGQEQQNNKKNKQKRKLVIKDCRKRKKKKRNRVLLRSTPVQRSNGQLSMGVKDATPHQFFHITFHITFHTLLSPFA